MKAQILEKLNELKAKSNKSYEAVHEALGYAVSTVRRWHKGESEPDLDELTSLVEFYGGSMDKLFVAVGKQELAASQEYGYQGVSTLVESYEARLKAKDEQYAQLEAFHQQQMEQERIRYDRSIEFLKNETMWLRSVVEALTRLDHQ